MDIKTFQDIVYNTIDPSELRETVIGLGDAAGLPQQINALTTVFNRNSIVGLTEMVFFLFTFALSIFTTIYKIGVRVVCPGDNICTHPGCNRKATFVLDAKRNLPPPLSLLWMQTMRVKKIEGCGIHFARKLATTFLIYADFMFIMISLGVLGKMSAVSIFGSGGLLAGPAFAAIYKVLWVTYNERRVNTTTTISTFLLAGIEELFYESLKGIQKGIPFGKGIVFPLTLKPQVKKFLEKVLYKMKLPKLPKVSKKLTFFGELFLLFSILIRKISTFVAGPRCDEETLLKGGCWQSTKEFFGCKKRREKPVITVCVDDIPNIRQEDIQEASNYYEEKANHFLNRTYKTRYRLREERWEALPQTRSVVRRRREGKIDYSDSGQQALEQQRAREMMTKKFRFSRRKSRSTKRSVRRKSRKRRTRKSNKRRSIRRKSRKSNKRRSVRRKSRKSNKRRSVRRKSRKRRIRKR